MARDAVTAATPLSEPLTAVLRDRRAELNARFAEARHRMPTLDPEAFGTFVRDGVDAVVRAMHATRPDRTQAVALAAFDVGLELIGRRVAGPGARSPAIDETWRRVLPNATRLVAAAPERLLAAMSNAAHQVAGTPDARPEQWIGELERLAGQCADADQLLRVGQVAAWRAGLAHYRRGAIAAASALPEPLALAAVGAPASASWADVESGLRASEWWDPARPDVRPSGAPPRLAAVVGSFRGFGGPFVAPPRVTLVDGHFHLIAGDQCWLLTADVFGATFHRAPYDASRAPRPRATLPNGLRVDGGSLAVGDCRVPLSGLGTVTSAAATETTLALTWSLTHRVTLAALA